MGVGVERGWVDGGVPGTELVGVRLVAGGVCLADGPGANPASPGCVIGCTTGINVGTGVVLGAGATTAEAFACDADDDT